MVVADQVESIPRQGGRRLAAGGTHSTAMAGLVRTQSAEKVRHSIFAGPDEEEGDLVCIGRGNRSYSEEGKSFAGGILAAVLRHYCILVVRLLMPLGTSIDMTWGMARGQAGMSLGERQLVSAVRRLETAGSVPAQIHVVHRPRTVAGMEHLHNVLGMAQGRHTQDAGHKHMERTEVEELRKARLERLGTRSHEQGTHIAVDEERAARSSAPVERYPTAEESHSQ